MGLETNNSLRKKASCMVSFGTKIRNKNEKIKHYMPTIIKYPQCVIKDIETKLFATQIKIEMAYKLPTLLLTTTDQMTTCIKNANIQQQ